MNTLKERVKVEARAGADDDFTIQDELARGQLAECLNQFGKIARERLACFRLQHDFIAAAESETAEAVPLGLIQPARTGGNLRYRLCFRGRIWRLNGQREFWKRMPQGFGGNCASSNVGGFCSGCSVVSGSCHSSTSDASHVTADCPVIVNVRRAPA